MLLGKNNDSDEKLSRLKEIEKIAKEMHEKSRVSSRPLPSIFAYAHLGLEFIVIFGVIFYVGYWLDKKFSTEPWLVIFGVIFGFVVAMFRLIQVAKELSQKEENSRKDEERTEK